MLRELADRYRALRRDVDALAAQHATQRTWPIATSGPEPPLER